MLTGSIRNKVDAIWDDIWAGGITNPITVIEQLTYAGSSFIVDHCGRDDAPYLKKNTPNCSGGYGTNTNYDKIKNNAQDGHNCIHVRKSRNHYNKKESKKHQDNIDYLQREKKESCFMCSNRKSSKKNGRNYRRRSKNNT